jgi:hypothetical protein
LSGLFGKELKDKRFPLFIERRGDRRMLSARVPVSCVRFVSLLPVQIRVNPAALAPGIRLCKSMGIIPFATRIVPESEKRTGQSNRLIPRSEGLSERVDGHKSTG